MFIGKFDAVVLADSDSPVGERLVTMQLTYPRCIHAEFMTHRMFSRNAASSRAIPAEQLIAHVKEHPFVPEVWGLNQPGMQARGEHADPETCRRVWLDGRDEAVRIAEHLTKMQLHKQLVNRVIEPWMWVTVIASGVAPAWENFFKLRCHPDAEPHIQKIAYIARDLYDAQEHKKLLNKGEFHLPLFGFPGDETITRLEDRIAVSVARCARVSYLTHDGVRDVDKDLQLYRRLAAAGHWSPFEHVAEATVFNVASNFGRGWRQHRKLFSTEYCKQAPRDGGPQ